MTMHQEFANEDSYCMVLRALARVTRGNNTIQAVEFEGGPISYTAEHDILSIEKICKPEIPRLVANYDATAPEMDEKQLFVHAYIVDKDFPPFSREV
jgi:hypothetical protein